MNKKLTLGIIGYGRFGKLMEKYLQDDFELKIHDKNRNNTDGINLRFTTLKNVIDSNIVIFAMPISALETVLIEIKDYVQDNKNINNKQNNANNNTNKNTLFIDVCSVKEYPVSLMEKYLPKHAQILATHPMFGPDSASETLDKRKIVLCPIKINNDLFEDVKIYLKSKKLEVIEMTPKEHDEVIAKTQLLTHFIGRTLIDMDIKQTDIDTEGYKRLLHILGVVKNDTWQLFEDMNKYNQYSKTVRDDFTKHLSNINNKLK